MAAVSMHENATPWKNLTNRRGQKGRSTMKARNAKANIVAPNIMTHFSGYLCSARPTRSLQNNDAMPRIPTRAPISRALEPNFFRYTGIVGVRVKLATKKTKNARNPRTKSRVIMSLTACREISFLSCMAATLCLMVSRSAASKLQASCRFLTGLCPEPVPPWLYFLPRSSGSVLRILFLRP